MAILFMEGCDLFNDQDDLRDAGRCGYFISGANRFGYGGTDGRYGGGAILGSTNTTPSLAWGFTPQAPGTTIYVGFWLYVTLSGSTSYQNLFAIRGNTSSTSILLIDHNNTGILRAQPNGGSSASSSAGAITSNTWHWIEVELLLGTDATNGAYDVRVDGASVVSASSIDTFDTSTPSISEFRIYGSNYARRFDDIVIWNNAGAAPTTWIGPSQIDTVRPDGNGAVQDWSGSYTDVDDAAGAADGDGTYIAATAPGDKSRFTTEAPAGTTTTIHAVQVRGRARKTASQNKTMRGYLHVNGSEGNGVTRGLQDSYGVHRLGIFPTNPDGGGAWTDAAVNDAQVGVEVIA